MVEAQDSQFSSCTRRTMSRQAAITDSDVIDGLNIGYMKIFGLWKGINDYRTTGKRNFIIKLELVMSLFCTLSYIFCQYLSYFVIEVDIQKAMFLNLNTVPALQMGCRVLVFYFRMGIQSRLYNLIRKDFLTTIPDHKRAEAEQIFMKISKKANMFCVAALIVNASLVTLWVADPGISVDYIAYHTGDMAAVTGGKKKILGGWYPLPMSEFPYYEAIFVYETIILIWGGAFLAVYICQFFQILMGLFAQFSVLGLHISTLKVENGGNAVRDSNVKRSNSSYKELCEILQEHQKLLRYANELKSVYNPLVAMTLGMGIFILIIGVSQFLFGETGNKMFIFKFMQFLGYQSIEVCMFCFGSSYVESASSDLQFAIYSSDWYKADVKFRKAAQMLMVRARKGETLTAIRMYPVNVETIMAILQFTYSVAALMSRMTE